MVLLQRPKIFPKVDVVEWLSAILTDQVTFAMSRVTLVTNSIGCSRWIEGITSLLSDGCIKSYDEYLSCCYSWGEVTGKIRRKISV